MSLGTSAAAGVTLLRAEEEGEERFGRERDMSGGCSMEKALGCLIRYMVDVRIPPASLSTREQCRSPGGDLGCRGQSPSYRWRGFGGGGLLWAALPWGGVARGCQGFAGQVFTSGLGHLEGIEFL